MAVIYVRSTDGSDADNGSTWALAKATLVGADGIDAAGDTIYVSQSHAESTAGAVVLTLAGSTTSPTKVICGNDASAPPTAVATSGTVTTTGNNPININNSSNIRVYWYGLAFISGSTATGTASITASGGQVFDSCQFKLATTGASSRISVNSVGSGTTTYKNCGFRFGASGQGLSTAGGTAHIIGGSLLSGGTSPTAFVLAPATPTNLNIDGFDFSNASASLNLGGSNQPSIKVAFRNCKLPASWSGSLNSSTPGIGSVWEMFNCDSADTHYRYRKATQFGTIQDETTLVRTGGASDGTTTYSLKLVTNVDAEYPMLTLDTPECSLRNSAVGSSKTLTVCILHDSATALKDDEIWLEAMYLGTSGVPLGSFVSDAKADVLATAANQTSSSATWTTTGMANPNKQELAVTFTPQEEGYLQFVVKMAKASYTVYVDLAGATLT